MQKARLSEVEICYDIAGSGEPIVLIPGFASGAWSWVRQVELSEAFTTVTFDPRGVACSHLADNAAVTIVKIAGDVRDLLDVLQIEKANILGVSFGGFVAQEFALNFPERLNKLVLACTSYGGAGHVPPSPEVLAAFASTAGLNSGERIRQYLTTAFMPEFTAVNASQVDKFCDLREQNEVPFDVYQAQLLSATTFDTSSRVQEIVADTLVITGDRDTVVPMQNSVNLTARIPNARLEVIAGAGHMVFVEQAEKFNQIVKEFLTS